MKHSRKPFLFKPGMSNGTACVVIGCIALVVTGLFFAAKHHKWESDRSQNILNIRNCQQAMRGVACMRQLVPGDPFTRKDLENYMTFPEDIQVLEGAIQYKAGTECLPETFSGAKNGDHLWLRMTAPLTTDYVGKYGFEDIDDVTGW